MTLTVMPSGCERLEQPLVVARLFGVRRVGEQHDVPRALVGFLHHLRRGDERGVGEDAAAHRLDAPDLVADPVLLARRRQRTDDVRRAVDGDHADLVERPERVDRRARAEIGQVHLRAAVAGRHRHAAGPIEHHGHRQRQLAMLVLDLHRHRQIRIEHRLEVAADAERRRRRRSAAGRRRGRWRSARVRRAPAARPGRPARSRGSRRDTRAGRPDRCGRPTASIVVHAKLAGRQRAAEIVRTAAGVDEQDRGRRLDAHRALADVVLGHAIAGRGELEAVARDAGPIDQVAERQLRRARLKGARRPARSRRRRATARPRSRPCGRCAPTP